MATIISMTVQDQEVRNFFKKDGLTKAFNKRFSQTLIGFRSHAVSQLRKQMESGRYPPLGITQYIGWAGPREPTRVFFDTGKFAESFKGHYVRESQYLTGMDFDFEGNSPKGYPYHKIAWMLEEGRRWTPTKYERSKVAMMAKARGAPEPDGPPKDQWEIPARHFLHDTFTKPEMMERFANLTLLAVTRAVEDMKKK